MNKCISKPSNIDRRGFTLIELLVVISIIAVLMAIMMPALAKVREQTRTLVCKTRMRDIGNVLNLYKQDNKDKLPPSFKVQGDNDSYDLTNVRWYLRISGYYDLQGAAVSQTFELFKCPVMEDWTRKAYGPSAVGIYGYNWFFTGAESDTSGDVPRFSWWKAPAKIKIPSELPLLGDSDGRDPLNTGRQPGWRMHYSNPHPAAFAKGWLDGDMRGPRKNYYGPAPNHGKDCNFLMADNHVETRNVCTEGQWPWIGTTAAEQQLGRAFHPTRTPSQAP